MWRKQEYSSSQLSRAAMGTHVPYGITVLPATRQRRHSRTVQSCGLCVMDITRSCAKTTEPTEMLFGV